MTQDPKQLLQSFYGSYQGTVSTWFEPGKPVIEEKIQGRFESGVNENFIVYTYKSSMQGNPFKGTAVLSFDKQKNKFQSAWMDSFHMSESLMYSEGDATEDGFFVLGNYIVEGTIWGWKTEYSISGANITITSYNITPDGQEYKGVEVVYKKVNE